MTHQYTKLADELDATAGNNSDMYEHERDSCREAARILRAAASVDVAGLMAMHDASVAAAISIALERKGDRHGPTRATLESALRMALAASPEDQIIELAQALEQRRALAITDAVHNLPVGGRTANMPTAFQAGYCAACEEIEHRLRTEEWTHCLKPVGAAAPKGTP